MIGVRLAVLTNIPTPYRSVFFDRLAFELQRNKGELLVVYCARTEWNRHWKLSDTDLRHPYWFAPGMSGRVGDYTLHVNAGVLRRLRQFRPTAVVVGGAWNMPASMAVAFLGRRVGLGKPILWSEGHADAVLNASGPIAWLRRLVLRRFEVFAVPNARGERYITGEVGPGRTFMRLPNVVDDEFYTPAPPEMREALRRQKGLNADETVFVQVAQLEERKGVLELLQAFARLREQHVSARMVLIGTGRLASRIMTEYARLLNDGSLRMTGNLPAEGVREWLRAADVFVLASHRDPNPLSVIEAALTGCPLILSAWVGNALELLDPHRNGWLVENNTPSELNKAMENAVLSASELVGMGQHSRDIAMRDFGLGRVVEDFVRHISTTRLTSPTPTRHSPHA